jgi:AraC-like DNA-binding protein
MKEDSDRVRRISKERISLSRSGMGVESFMMYNANDRGKYQHSHDFVEMVFLLRGELWNEIDGNRYIQHEGQLALVNYGSEHSLFCHNADLYNIYLDMGVFPLNQLAPEILNALVPFLMPHPEVVNRRNRVRLFSMDNPGFIGSLLHRLEEYSRKGKVGERALFHGMNLFLSELALSMKNQSETDDSEVFHLDKKGIQEDMERVIGQIERDYVKELSLENLSDLAGCSPVHLCRKFKAYTGLTVGDYLLERRLRQAMYLLRSTTDKISYIASESGFAHLTHFQRKFKKYTGMSAGEFRKNS